MRPTTLIQPDFARRRWTASDGAAHESPDARRAPAHHRDDFGIPAENPRLVAELLVALERFAPDQPRIVIARGLGLSRVDRVQVDHAGHTTLLTPADARLAAATIEAEPAFEGAWGVAAELREAANRIDFARAEPVTALGTGADNDDPPPAVRMAGWTVVGLAVLIAFAVAMSFAPLPGAQ